jgi:chemotaxis signal transduction protein
MVCFRAGGADYCVTVEAIRAVRAAAGMIPLPAPRKGIAGILPGEDALTVTSALGPQGAHILVIEVDQSTYGLLVDEVTGLRRIDESEIGPAPAGQDHELISGVVNGTDSFLLVADPAAIGMRL